MTPFAQMISDLDTYSLAQVCDRTIDELVRDYGLVSYIEAHPNEATETRVGHNLTIQGELTIFFTDQSELPIDVIVKGNDEDGALAITSLTRLQVPA